MTDRRHLHEVKRVDEDGLGICSCGHTVSHGDVTALLWGRVSELRAMVESLEGRVENLEYEVSDEPKTVDEL